MGVSDIRIFPPFNSLDSQLSFKLLKVALAPLSGEKIVIIAEKSAYFWPNFPTSKCSNFKFCHSLRGLTYKYRGQRNYRRKKFKNYFNLYLDLDN